MLLADCLILIPWSVVCPLQLQHITKTIKVSSLLVIVLFDNFCFVAMWYYVKKKKGMTYLVAISDQKHIINIGFPMWFLVCGLFVERIISRAFKSTYPVYILLISFQRTNHTLGNTKENPSYLYILSNVRTPIKCQDSIILFFSLIIQKDTQYISIVDTDAVNWYLFIEHERFKRHSCRGLRPVP